VVEGSFSLLCNCRFCFSENSLLLLPFPFQNLAFGLVLELEPVIKVAEGMMVNKFCSWSFLGCC
jgi:hypothetical protein